MALEDVQTLASHYKHIDNGGPGVEVEMETYTDGTVSYNLVLESSYFGYPTVTAKLPLPGCSDVNVPGFLASVGAMLIQASTKIVEIDKERAKALKVAEAEWKGEQ